MNTESDIPNLPPLEEILAKYNEPDTAQTTKSTTSNEYILISTHEKATRLIKTINSKIEPYEVNLNYDSAPRLNHTWINEIESKRAAYVRCLEPSIRDVLAPAVLKIKAEHPHSTLALCFHYDAHLMPGTNFFGWRVQNPWDDNQLIFQGVAELVSFHLKDIPRKKCLRVGIENDEYVKRVISSAHGMEQI